MVGSTLGGTPAGPGVPARARSARIRDEINGKMLHEEARPRASLAKRAKSAGAFQVFVRLELHLRAEPRR